MVSDPIKYMVNMCYQFKYDKTFISSVKTLWTVKNICQKNKKT